MTDGMAFLELNRRVAPRISSGGRSPLPSRGESSDMRLGLYPVGVVVMIAVAILAAFVVFMGILNVIDFGRID